MIPNGLLIFITLILLIITGLISYVTYKVYKELKDPVTIGNTVGVSQTGSLTIGNTVGVSQTGIIDSNIIPVYGERDLFERERVAIPYTLGDYAHIYGINPDFFDIIEGGASITYTENKALARLELTGGVSGNCKHQTKRYHHYMPGKSQTLLSSFIFYQAQENVTKKTGLFDDINGLYLQQDGDGTLSFVIESGTSSPSELTSVPQSNWNIDKADGTGKSGYNIDINKTQLMFITYQWLGVGNVDFGFVDNSNYILCHSFVHDNLTDEVYLSNPNLPVSCQIQSSVGVSSTYFDQICSTVISEGGYGDAGRIWSAGTSVYTSITSNAEIPIIAIKLKDSFGTFNYHNRVVTTLGNVNLITAGENIVYSVKKANRSSDLSASTWYDVNIESACQYATNFTLPSSDFFEIEGGFASGSTQGNKPSGFTGAEPPVVSRQNYIVQNVDSNDSETFYITAKRLGTNNTSVAANIQWREIF